MNIDFQICGLIITCVLLFFYNSKRHLSIYSEKIFERVLGVTFMVLCLDITSVISIECMEYLPIWFVELVCKMYVFSLVFNIGVALMYIMADMVSESQHKSVFLGYLIFSLIELILIFELPIYIFRDGRIVYTYGPSTTAAYSIAFLSLIPILIVTIAYRKRIYARRWLAFVVWIAMWISAAVVQFFNSELLLVSFASSIGMVILYIVMENPEVNFNKKLNCFNSYALGKYLLDLYDHNTPFFVTSISFENEVEEGDEECIKQLIRVVHKNSHTYIFKELNMNFLLISKNEQEYKSVMKWIESEHTREDGTLKNILFICMDDGLKAGSPKHLSALLGYFRTKYRINDMSEIYCLNDELIQEFLVQENMVDEIRKAIASDRVEVFFSLYTRPMWADTRVQRLLSE